MPHELPKSYEPGAIETRWADYWIEEKLFSAPTPPPARPGEATRPVFTLLLPPPNVTGRLHMGHMLNQTQMDIIVRWHRMRGFLTLWLPGTDHAGIATQMMVERQLAKEGKKRREMGREKFVERVWEWKKLYGGAILDQMKRLGASVDWDREYFTMDENLSRAVREVFVRLYEEGPDLSRQVHRELVPALRHGDFRSRSEARRCGGKLWEIRYPVIGTAEFITVATTRPETMLGDTAIAVNAKDERYTHLHGKTRAAAADGARDPDHHRRTGAAGVRHGAVKVTPAHDPNDFRGRPAPQLAANRRDGRARAHEPERRAYAGLDRYRSAQASARRFAGAGISGWRRKTTRSHLASATAAGRWLSRGFRAVVHQDQAAGRARDRSGGERRDHDSFPENYKQIYLNWMNNIHDWCISRQLWWGHRIPAWHCADCHEMIVARETPAKCSQVRGAKLEQDTDVLDTWFSSGLLAVYDAGLAGKDARPGHVLSEHAADYGLRHPVFLGGAHDHVGLPLHAGARAGRGDQEGERLG
jgi:valyl-tRNA synthetase